MRSCITSSPFVGIDRVVGVMVTAPSRFNLLSFSHRLLFFSACPHTNAAYVSFGRMMPVKSQRDKMGFGPYLFFMMFDVYIRELLHVLRTVSMWSFQFSFSSIITPRYLISVENGMGLPFTCSGGGILSSFIFRLWKITTTVLSGLNFSPYPRPQSTNLSTAFCRSFIAPDRL